jgi:hypothetical protein
MKSRLGGVAALMVGRGLVVRESMRLLVSESTQFSHLSTQNGVTNIQPKLASLLHSLATWRWQ